MRRFLVSAVGVACAAVIALPPTSPAAGAAQPSGRGGSGEFLAGSTRTLALVPLRASTRALGARPAEGLPARTVKPFSLLGATWDDADRALHATVRVRSRAVGTGVWSPWQDVETHTDDVPDMANTSDRDPRRTRGATVPLWVGDSDGVQVRVQPERPERFAGTERSGGPERFAAKGRSGRPERPDRATRALGPAPALPAGLRLEMVDPGDEPGPGARGVAKGAVAHSAARPVSVDSADRPDSADWSAGSADWSAGSADWAGSANWSDWARRPHSAGRPAAAGLPEAPEVPDAPYLPDLPDLPGSSVLPALTRQQVRAQLPDTLHAAARPRIITRAGWGADASLRKGGPVYTKKVKVVFVHHSGTGNSYTCAKAPSVVRSIYRYHVKSRGWRDIGYNFLVDKCGNIYEGRAGGVTRAVLGAHTLGFNSNSMGVAVLGTYSHTNPSSAALAALARLTAWKLGLFGANPAGSTHLTSGGGDKYKKGKSVKLRVISGHRDGFVTECPGARLYERLGVVRANAAELQGR